MQHPSLLAAHHGNRGHQVMKRAAALQQLHPILRPPCSLTAK